ncbi:MAG: hypothetical protein LBC18_07900 [Opitutaceae bacterium]|jgi:hypothetical protein|nr:hypothetical protein [Opitutaceae bacterium]
MTTLTRFILAASAVLSAGAPSMPRAMAAPSTEETFRTPGQTAGPWVYWIWINGNVTKEGIRADLEDMRRAGIGGAMLFDGSLYLPAGPVRYGTDDWHGHVQFAIKTAAGLGLKIVLMNCAGWATSGGPWNDAGHSMKMLVWSGQSVPGGTGGRAWRGKLPPPPSRLGYYRDVAVLAVPGAGETGETAPALTNETPGMETNADALADHDGTTGLEFAHGAKIRFAFPRAVTMRRLEIDLVRDAHQESPEGLGTDDDMMPGGLIEASDDGRVFRAVKKFPPARQEFGSRVEIAFEPVTARFFRASLQPRPGGAAAAVPGAGAGARKPWRIAEMHFANTARLDGLPGKTGLRTLPPPQTADWDADAPGEFKAAQVLDLTDRLAPDGSLAWDAPAGPWTVLRFGCTTSARKNHPAPPEGEGLEVDKFDGEAVVRHFEHALGRIIREAGPEAGRALAGVLCDSWEAGPQTWTGRLPAIFKQKRGYDMRPFLPALTGRVIDSPAATEKFLADYRRTLGELYADNYYGTMQRMANRRGLKFFAEAYGGVLDEPAALEHVDVPMVEFWTFGLYKGFDYAPSTAHLMGKKIIAAEAFTGRPPRARWGETPGALKTLGDAAYAAGVNSLVLHSYVHQPRDGPAPGFTHGRYGTHFGRLNSWWPLAPAWIAYLQRCQFLLRHGRPVADILCLRDERLKTEHRELPPAVLKGCHADLISVSQLPWLHVENGMLRTKAGATYRVLALPEKWPATAATLAQLARLKSAGAAIAGPPPLASATLADTPDAWRRAVDAVFGDGACARPLADTPGLAPDFTTDDGGDLRFFHRAAADGDYYFVTNQTGKPVDTGAAFRIADRCPELWDPATGAITGAPAWRVENGCTRLRLSLDATGSVFVVFRKPLPPVWPVAVADGRITLSDGATRAAPAVSRATLAVRGPWTVSFAPATGREMPPAIFDTLVPLETHADPEIRWFSGLATYTTTFNLDLPPPAPASNRRISINLGAVHDLAEIIINGRSAGVCWKPPYALDATALVRAGENQLKVTVANRWVNRLIGDEQLPPDLDYGTTGSALNALQKFPPWRDDPGALRRRARHTFSTWKHYTADSPLVPSGLAGPVAIEIYTTSEPSRPAACP